MGRDAGLLLALSSLPSDHGIGDLGDEANKFIDILEQMGMRIWQLLPLNPLGYGNSPYQPYSSYAGDSIYISLDKLFDMGLIKSKIPNFNESSNKVEYEKVRHFKQKYLKEAYENFDISDEEYNRFIKENKWVKYYALYMTFKKINGSKVWNEWPKEFRDYPLLKSIDLTKYENDINYEMFLQFIFQKQWLAIKQYANEKNIKVMGDIPIYVSIDSQDVWQNRDFFLLDENEQMTYVAGVPPDYFSKDGQRWGNPIYDWDVLQKNNFDFWVNRIKENQKLFDILRIDHFRAFDTYWKIPASEDTARNGQWVEAPGKEVIQTLYDKIPNLNLVVEDLGEIREEVRQLRDHFNLKGMKIVQFTFDVNENNNEFEDRKNMIIYTGTHDNQTIKGWYDSQQKKEQEAIKRVLGTDNIVEGFIEYTLRSIADYAIIPVQDVLGLDDSARTNTPGTVGSPNWEWKLVDLKGCQQKVGDIKALIKKTKR